MASVSPSMAFEPTPALEMDKENYSPLTEHLNSSMHDNRLERQSSKEVHFSPAPSSPRRAQSLATSVPFLEPVSSASQLPRHRIRNNHTTPEVDMNAYMEQSRALLESQRLNFDREREIFEKERKLWNAERAMLNARIADLEFNLNKNTNGRRRFSNDAPTVSMQSFRRDFGQRSSLSSFRASRVSSETNGGVPVWETPTPETGAPVTRVFASEDQQPPTKKSVCIPSSLPSIAEKPGSPRSVPVPVTVLDSSLDGITLKSAGLESSFVKIHSPSSTSPPQPPSPGPRIEKEQKILRINMDGLLSPTDANLVRNAGHTPMEFGNPATSGDTASGVASRKSPEVKAQSPRPESGLSSRPPTQPSERADSYFVSALEPVVTEQAFNTDDQGNADGDVELKGPLTMSSQLDKDNPFLSQLDAKLLAEAQKPHTNGDTVKNSSGESHDVVKLDDEEEEVEDVVPKLRLKKSTNFGSAFGSTRCGNI